MSAREPQSIADQVVELYRDLLAAVLAHGGGAASLGRDDLRAARPGVADALGAAGELERVGKAVTAATVADQLESAGLLRSGDLEWLADEARRGARLRVECILGDIRRGAPRVEEATSPAAAVWVAIGLLTLTSPRKARRWLLHHPDGDGLMRLGRVFMLVAEGGIGKTVSLLYLAVCLITGRRWLDYFVPGDEAIGANVLLLLGEEEDDEVEDILKEIVEALRLTPDELQAVADHLVVRSLAGQMVALTRVVAGDLVETESAAEIRRQLAARERWSLIVIDPEARFAAGDVEVDSQAGTRLMQVVESLAKDAPGNPATLVAAHSSKIARRLGKTDLRGTTSRSDASRGVWALTAKADGAVEFSQLKSNYSKPWNEPLRLRRHGRLLFAESKVDAAVAEELKRAEGEAAITDLVPLVVEALRRHGGPQERETLAKLVGRRLQDARAAVDLAVSAGLVVRTTNGRKSYHSLPTATEEVGGTPPHTPRDVGTTVPDATAGRRPTSGTTTGRRRDDGTTRVKEELDDLDEVAL